MDDGRDIGILDALLSDETGRALAEAVEHQVDVDLESNQLRRADLALRERELERKQRLGERRRLALRLRNAVAVAVLVALCYFVAQAGAESADAGMRARMVQEQRGVDAARRQLSAAATAEEAQQAADTAAEKQRLDTLDYCLRNDFAVQLGGAKPDPACDPPAP